MHIYQDNKNQDTLPALFVESKAVHPPKDDKGNWQDEYAVLTFGLTANDARAFVEHFQALEHAPKACIHYCPQLEDGGSLLFKTHNGEFVPYEPTVYASGQVCVTNDPDILNLARRSIYQLFMSHYMRPSLVSQNPLRLAIHCQTALLTQSVCIPTHLYRGHLLFHYCARHLLKSNPGIQTRHSL